MPSFDTSHFPNGLTTTYTMLTFNAIGFAMLPTASLRDDASERSRRSRSEAIHFLIIDPGIEVVVKRRGDVADMVVALAATGAASPRRIIGSGVVLVFVHAI